MESRQASPDMKRKYALLLTRQALPLGAKIKLTKQRIREFYRAREGAVYVAFSEGKDSTVLLHLVRQLYPDTPAVFNNTGLEFPEIVRFARGMPNLEQLRPKLTYKQVLEKYGYPVVSKEVASKIDQARRLPKDGKTYKLVTTGIRSDGKYCRRSKIPDKWMYLIEAPFKISGKCCEVMKKNPAKAYEKRTGLKPYVGMMACDSSWRLHRYLKVGCNIYEGRAIQSNPLGFWTEADIWAYLRKYNVPYCSIYDMGYRRTGCVFCMFGVDQEPQPNRFQLLARTHPGLYKFCMENLDLREVLAYLNVPSCPLKQLEDYAEVPA